MELKELETRIRQLRDEAGYGNFDFVIRKLKKERVSTARDKRVNISASLKRELYERQEGICACGCGEDLLRSIRKNHADHFDPNETQFNRKSNLRLLLPEHNLQKSSKDPLQVSKETGRTTLQQIEGSRLNSELIPK